MTRTTLPLCIALALSVLVNVALLRRSPADPAPRAAAPARATPEPAPSLEGRPADLDADVLILREEVRKLREQLAISRASHELEKSRLAPTLAEKLEEPESLHFAQVRETIEALVEARIAEGVDQEGRLVKYEKPVLTPENLREAVRILADYGALEGASRSAFQRMTGVAIDQYRLITEEAARDLDEVQKAGQIDESFENRSARMQAYQDRATQRSNRWEAEHLQPLRELLDRRDGVRPALLSRNLSEILSRLSFADER